MGCVIPKSQTPESLKSSEIDEGLKKQRMESTIRLLLLGTGDSGKSTFARQLRRIHATGFSEVDYEKFVWILMDNCLRSMQKLLTECNKTKEVIFHPEMETNVALVLQSEELRPAVADSISILWNTNELKQFFVSRQDIDIPTCAEYYFNNALRFSDRNFRPTDEDIIRAKLKTSGIIEIGFSVNNINFSVVDVGGQRSERRKWIHAFDHVAGVIFLVALDEYNKTLEEDRTVNRMDESIMLLKEVSTSVHMADKIFMLFLNKSDVFREKIKTFPLSRYCRDVPPDVGSDFDKSVEYMTKKYSAGFAGTSPMHTFVTFAIDTKNCQRIFDTVLDIVINASLKEAGFL